MIPGRAGQIPEVFKLSADMAACQGSHFTGKSDKSPVSRPGGPAGVQVQSLRPGRSGCQDSGPAGPGPGARSAVRAEQTVDPGPAGGRRRETVQATT
jgi:hypothetical protein